MLNTMIKEIGVVKIEYTGDVNTTREADRIIDQLRFIPIVKDSLGKDYNVEEHELYILNNGKVAMGGFNHNASRLHWLELGTNNDIIIGKVVDRLPVMKYETREQLAEYLIVVNDNLEYDDRINVIVRM